MTTELAAVIAALQAGDSQFPSGAFAFSWGLESMARERRTDRLRLAALMAAELEQRWAGFDRVFIARALQADVETQFAIDADIEAMSWSEALRDGSRRAGAGLLTMHARLGTPGAATLRNAVLSGDTPGHLPLAQGVVFAGLGLDRMLALSVSGYGLLAGLGSAAVRLGLAGAVEVQRAIAMLGPRLAELAAEAPPAEPHAFSPLMEIAMMRHGEGAAPLFSN